MADAANANQKIVDEWGRMIDACKDDFLSTVAVYGLQDEILHKERTGILFAVGDSHFIITAAHYLEDYASISIPLYTAPVIPGDNPIPLGGKVYGNKAIDIAVMELSKDVVQMLAPRRKFLRITDVDLSCEECDGLYVVVGYPNASNYSICDIENRRITNYPFQYGALLYKGSVDADLGYNPSHNIVLKHLVEGLNAQQESQRAPSFEGMSGCGIWRLKRNDQGIAKPWTPEDRRLVAIQVSCKPGSFIKGAWIAHALRLIAENSADCKRALEITQI